MRDATKAIVRNYHRLCRWLDIRDLIQEAEVAKLEAAQTYETGGPPPEAYNARAMAFSVRRYVMKARAPVSGSSHENALQALGGTRACDLQALRSNAGDSGQYERHVDMARAAKIVHSVLNLLEDGQLAGEVLLHERKSAEVAKAYRVPVRTVYRAARAARVALAEQPTLRAYGEES